MQFGEKLKELRSTNGMTQKDLAEKINISPQAVSRWEKNEVEPSLETLRRLAEIFDVSMDDLFGKEKKQETDPPAQPLQNPKVVLAICEGCNTPIYEKEEVFRSVDKNGQKTVLCRACHRRQTQKKLEEKRNKAVAELQAEETKRKRGYLFGGLIGGAILFIGVIAAICEKDPKPLAVWSIIGVLSFMGFFCVFAGDSIIGDMGEHVMTWSFHAPGILFEWSEDGIIDFILLKIVFWLIGVVVGICTFFLGIAVVLVCSPFAFPYDVYAVNRDIRNLQRNADAATRELKSFQNFIRK